ncbi:MAG: hypothetical protein NC215_01705 [Ruminococcus sp.]|nr:hypothetical protein [Ruminococcus sp.]MCM1391938.1 hypothetical protein [Ruminococcus sp.]
MFKKFISFIFVIICVMTTFTNVFAINEESVEIYSEPNHAYHQTIIDPEKLSEIESTEQLDDYKLEKVNIDSYIFDTDLENIAITPGIEPNALLYKIQNVKTESPFVFPDIYDLDVYQGPANISTTYTRTEEVGLHLGISIGNSTVSAAVGYDISKKYTVSKTFSTTVPSGKILHVKIHVIYRRTSFDIYNKYTNNCVKKYAYTDKPIGLQFTQYTYG